MSIEKIPALAELIHRLRSIASTRAFTNSKEHGHTCLALEDWNRRHGDS